MLRKRFNFLRFRQIVRPLFPLPQTQHQIPVQRISQFPNRKQRRLQIPQKQKRFERKFDQHHKQK